MPSTIAVDDTSVYWVDESDDSIDTMPKIGGKVTSLATGQYELSLHGWSFAVDDAYGQTLFWSDSSGAIGHLAFQ